MGADVALIQAAGEQKKTRRFLSLRVLYIGNEAT
jgi:hypothetical protein